MNSSLIRLLVLCSLALATGSRAQPYFLLPGAEGLEAQGSVTLRYGGRTLAYTAGLGWLGEGVRLESAPIAEGGQVYLQEDVLNALGVTLPRLSGVRSSGGGTGGTVRLVFDLEGPVDPAALERVRRTGAVGPQEALTLHLPPLLLPRDLPVRQQGLRLEARAEAEGTQLLLSGLAFAFEAFPLRDPHRVVVDVTTDTTADPTATEPLTTTGVTGDARTADAALDLREHLLSPLAPDVPAAPRTLAPGVTLRRLNHPTVAGTSRVDLVEVAPNSGRFGVVQAAGAQPLSDLAAGALVGLNASYFNTETGQTIGLLKRAGELLSLPSRNRAAIGFGFGRPLVGRLGAELRFSLGGRPYRLRDTDGVTLHTTPGERAGSPRRGALVVVGDRVTENKVGPRTVPPGGFVLSYTPEQRQLALLDAGDRFSYTLQVTPRAFGFAPEAVEAGPLLVQDGRPAYAPELEAFDIQSPGSSVNRRTTRAAIGVREDGTALLLTAANLTAAELVPLFLSLGAESALQMDSGGSSTLLAAGEVVNRPPFSQRPIATAVVFTPNAPLTSSAPQPVAQPVTQPITRSVTQPVAPQTDPAD